MDSYKPPEFLHIATYSQSLLSLNSIITVCANRSPPSADYQSHHVPSTSPFTPTVRIVFIPLHTSTSASTSSFLSPCNTDRVTPDALSPGSISYFLNRDPDGFGIVALSAPVPVDILRAVASIIHL
jgi:hypothetical protein